MPDRRLEAEDHYVFTTSFVCLSALFGRTRITLNHQEAPRIYLARDISSWHNANASDVHRFILDAARMPAMMVCARSLPGQMWIVGKDNDSVMVRITWGSGANRAVLLQGYAERHVNNYFNWSQDGTEIDQTPGSPSDNVSVATPSDDH